MKYKHKLQGISLFIAIGLLWYLPWVSHKTAMIIASVIIGVNGIMEVFG